MWHDKNDEKRKLSTTLAKTSHKKKYKSTKDYWQHRQAYINGASYRGQNAYSFDDAGRLPEQLAHTSISEIEQPADFGRGGGYFGWSGSEPGLHLGAMHVVSVDRGSYFQHLEGRDQQYQARRNSPSVSSSDGDVDLEQIEEIYDEVFAEANYSEPTSNLMIENRVGRQEDTSSDEEIIRAFKQPTLTEETFTQDYDLLSQLNTNSNLRIGDDFSTLCKSQDYEEAMMAFKRICLQCELVPGHINTFFPHLKSVLKREVNNRYDELIERLELKRNLPVYKNGQICKGQRVLIIGGGPCGLRLALETQLLGAHTIVMESRAYIDRNNVLKLWQFVIEDLKNLGAKKFCPNLGNGSLNTVSIKQLQFIMLKIAVLLGVEIRSGQTFKALEEPSGRRKWSVVSERKDEQGNIITEREEFDAVIGATGRKMVLRGFQQQRIDTKMAIAITANFINYNTQEEKRVNEIPGLSKQYDQAFFHQMERDTGIKLENIVYYQDNTHYFVMTAKKKSLLRKGVIKRDLTERDQLLREDNIDRTCLEAYAREAAEYSTAHFSHQLPRMPFASWKNRNDVSIFDFTNLFRSQNACRVISRHGQHILTGIVGDSLIEPFWPEGTGIGQGFLGVYDTAWMIARYFSGEDLMQVIREREKLYALLRQTGQKSFKANFDKWSLDPKTRYHTTTFPFNQAPLNQLYDTDTNLHEDYLDSHLQGYETTDTSFDDSGEFSQLVRRHKQSIAQHPNRQTVFIADDE